MTRGVKVGVHSVFVVLFLVQRAPSVPASEL